MSADCVFCKIISSELPASFVYRGKEVSAFLDIHPINRGHVLIVPNEHHQFFENIPSQIFSKMALLAQDIQKAYNPAGIKLEGSNFFLSNGAVAGQEVPHAHLHLAPRFKGDGHRMGFSGTDADAATRDQLNQVSSSLAEVLNRVDLSMNRQDCEGSQAKNQIKQLQEKAKLPEFSSIQKIKALRRDGKADQAFDAVQSAIAQFPNSPELQYLAGSICDAYRTETEAVPFYLRSLELGLSGPDRRDAILGLASTYRSIGKYEESKRIFEMGIKEFPEYRPYQVFLALTEFNLKQSDISIRRLLEQLIETTSDQEIRSYEKALRFYSTRLSEVFV